MPLNRIKRLTPWNTNGLVKIDQNNYPTKNVSNVKDSYDLNTVMGNYHNEWKPRPFNKENHSINNDKNYAQLNQVKNKFEIFGKKNVN